MRLRKGVVIIITVSRSREKESGFLPPRSGTFVAAPPVHLAHAFTTSLSPSYCDTVL